MDFLKSAVASAIAKGPLAAYSVTDRVDVDNSIWTLNNATKRVCRASRTTVTTLRALLMSKAAPRKATSSVASLLST